MKGFRTLIHRWRHFKSPRSVQGGLSVVDQPQVLDGRPNDKWCGICPWENLASCAIGGGQTGSRCCPPRPTTSDSRWQPYRILPLRTDTPFTIGAAPHELSRGVTLLKAIFSHKLNLLATRESLSTSAYGFDRPLVLWLQGKLCMLGANHSLTEICDLECYLSACSNYAFPWNQSSFTSLYNCTSRKWWLGSWRLITHHTEDCKEHNQGICLIFSIYWPLTAKLKKTTNERASINPNDVFGVPWIPVQQY